MALMVLARGSLGALVGALIALCGTAATAGAASSVAYLENGEVWVSSLDAATRHKVAAPVVDSDGQTQMWTDVTAADNGRLLAVRRPPNRDSRYSWYQVWDGLSSPYQGSLPKHGSYTSYAYPLGMDLTADGAFVVYGYSDFTYGYPTSTLAQGHYVHAVNIMGAVDTYNKDGQLWPSVFGRRVIGASGNDVNVQAAANAPHALDFTFWFNTAGTGLEQTRTDVAASGQLAAVELEKYEPGTSNRIEGKIAVLSIPGVDSPPTPAVDCYIPAEGLAKNASLSQDGTRIAWQDAGGVKIAGVPTTAADPCVFSSPPVVISATGSMPSIGGADVSTFAPPPTTGPGTGAAGAPGAPSPGGGPQPSTPGAPAVTLPGKITTKVLASKAGFALKVDVTGAGPITVTGSVPASKLGRRGKKPVVVATGKGTATRAGRIVIRLRLNATGRRNLRRLRGARLTLKVTQAGRTTTKTAKLS
jgi:hypothetical protein